MTAPKGSSAHQRIADVVIDFSSTVYRRFPLNLFHPVTQVIEQWFSSGLEHGAAKLGWLATTLFLDPEKRPDTCDGLGGDWGAVDPTYVKMKKIDDTSKIAQYQLAPVDYFSDSDCKPV